MSSADSYCDLSLDTDLQLVYWTSLAVFTLAFLAFFVAWLYQYFAGAFACMPPRKTQADGKHPASMRHVRSGELHLFDDGHLTDAEIALARSPIPFSFASITRGAIIFLLNASMYVVLLMGQGQVWRADLGFCIPWLRWATYAVSCSILAYEIALFQRMFYPVRWIFVVSITLTLLTGVFSILSTRSETNRWLWFALGCVYYAVALFVLFFMSDPCRFLGRGRRRLMLPVFVLVTWTIYPIAFGLGPTFGNAISLAEESWLYLFGDVFTKVVFSVWLAYLEVHVRKENLQ